jgi:Phosphatidylserine decarboxylase
MKLAKEICLPRLQGRRFSVAGMLADVALSEKYIGGSMLVFRLAPQDYHRFHSPVSGHITCVLSAQALNLGKCIAACPMLLADIASSVPVSEPCVSSASRFAASLDGQSLFLNHAFVASDVLTPESVRHHQSVW